MMNMIKISSRNIWITICSLLSIIDLNEALSPLDRMVFVINSQSDLYHHEIALSTKDQIIQSLNKIGVNSPKVYLTHLEEEISQHGAWTYFPIIQELNISDVDWVLFIEENAVVNANKLLEVIENLDPKIRLFIGSALIDEDHVIIHHYDKPHLTYPNPNGGFLLSYKLVKEIQDKMDEIQNLDIFPNFSIDPQYEFTKIIFNVFNNLRMINDSAHFCSSKQLTQDNTCSVYPRNLNCDLSQAELIQMAKKTLFAVKTCEKYYSTRLPIIRDTWAKSALNIKYFSEKENSDWNTIALPGVKNTERGHCKKTMEIIKYFNLNREQNNWDWLVIADDDTILGVEKLLKLLSCYNPNNSIHLGQRYGYIIANGKHGYDYVTGGGGMVFSKTVVSNIIEQACYCSQDSSPDDMHLGVCLSEMGISIIHNSRFHQGRPEDYPSRLIENQDPISFHKFWNNKPRQIYKNYFEASDMFLKNHKLSYKHEEL